MTRLLLLSNSTNHGEKYLDWAESDLRDFLGGIRTLLFVPYALHDLDGYANTARERFARMGVEVTSVHQTLDPEEAASKAESIFIGGGNTFRLLTWLYDKRLVDAIRTRVREGIPYIGASAGTNVACATIKTTNDMPIVYPPTFDAMELVPFQINAHYLDPMPDLKHMGETREQRIREFHEMNDTPVVGLREGCLLRREGSELTLKGPRSARIFRKGADPVEIEPGSSLRDLLADR